MKNGLELAKFVGGLLLFVLLILFVVGAFFAERGPRDDNFCEDGKWRVPGTDTCEDVATYEG